MSSAKAPGLDGWVPGEMKLLLVPLLQLLVRFFIVVERVGQWPDALQQPEGLLLPKEGNLDDLPLLGRHPRQGGQGLAAGLVPGRRPWRGRAAGVGSGSRGGGGHY